MIFTWLKMRRAKRELIKRDAAALIERFGDDAYLQARNWVIGELAYKIVDADRAPGHWQMVRAEIRRRSGKGSGSDTATRYLKGDK